MLTVDSPMPPRDEYAAGLCQALVCRGILICKRCGLRQVQLIGWKGILGLATIRIGICHSDDLHLSVAWVDRIDLNRGIAQSCGVDQHY